MAAESSFATIQVERQDSVLVLTLDRPVKRNAIDRTMVEEIRSVLTETRADSSVQVLVLTGSKKVFASGADIAELKARSQADALAGINSRLFQEVEAWPKPTIAALEGFALGGGCELALACDLRVGSETLKIGQPEVSLGILPAAGGIYRLPRVVGLAKAKELVFTGRILGGQEALDLGLINHLVPSGEALSRALELAREIQAQDPLAVGLAKRLFQALTPATPGFEFESVAQAICFESAEKHRRMQGFLDKKKAKVAKAD